jgi:hypothetical protein
LVTSSTISSHSNYVFYGQSGVRWGESPNAGSWAGAGTNGGTNLVVLINSCGLRAPYYGQNNTLHAGLHLLVGIMPVSNNAAGFADAVGDSARGSYLGWYLRYLPGTSIRASWFGTMNSEPQTAGRSCPNLNTNYYYGGGYGVDGCGAYYSISVAQNQDWATWHAYNETWSQVQSVAYDATGNQSGWIYWNCNYDCDTWPFTR